MIWTLIVGLVIGILAKFLMPGKDPGGFIVTILLGVAGSVLAHFIGSSLGMYQEGEPAGFVASILGAIILLGIYRAVIRRQHQIPHHRT